MSSSNGWSPEGGLISTKQATSGPPSDHRAAVREMCAFHDGIAAVGRAAGAPADPEQIPDTHDLDVAAAIVGVAWAEAARILDCKGQFKAANILRKAARERVGVLR